MDNQVNTTDIDDDDIEDLPLYLAFHVDVENYLVSVQSVAEVIRVPKLVPVPDVPDYIPGVVNLRGRVVPVVDMATRFGLAAAPENTRPVIIVVHSDEDRVGLMVEGVKKVLAVRDDQVDRTALAERGSSVIEGIAACDAGDFLIIDVRKLVAACRPTEAQA